MGHLGTKAKRTAFGLALLLGSGCATSDAELHAVGGQRVEIPEEENAPPPPPPKANVEQTSAADQAKAFRTAIDCANSAQSLRLGDTKLAWELYAECARRQDFTDMYRLLAPPWLEEVKRRGKDGLRVVANVMANRGGNIELDLAHVHDKGLQIFRLDDAVGNPTVFRGRYVMLRGRITGREVGKDAQKLTIVETTLQAENFKERGWQRTEVDDSTSKRKDFAYGKKDWGYGSKTERRSRWRYGDHVVHTRNVSRETKNRVVGYLADPARELKTDTDYLFLVKYAELAAQQGNPEDTDLTLSVAAVVDAFEALPE